MHKLITTRTDKTGRLTFVSEPLLNILNYKCEQLIGKKKIDLYAVKHPLEQAKMIRQVIKDSGVWQGELILKDSSNNNVYLESICNDVYNKNGNSIGYLTIHFDITDKKLAEKRSITDSLTNLYNRLKLDSLIEHEINRSHRSKQPFSIILLDIDHFKKINDKYGHIQGDKVIKQVAQSIKSCIRKIDFAGRWGGEEFLIICPNTSIKGALIIGEKIRRKIGEHTYKNMHNITISGGIACYTNYVTPEILLNSADKALYKAKENGRNKIEYYN